MRPTRLGLGAVGMGLLTLTAAASTGNNLLYLLYSAVAAALLLSAAAGRAALRGVAASLEPGAQGFRGREFPVALRVENRGRMTRYGLSVRWGERVKALAPVEPGASALARLSCVAPHRGLNRIEGLFVETLFPFGLIRHRRPVEVVVLALPRTGVARSAAELSADASDSGRPETRKGRGEELFGVRAYDAADEARAINWKLSARTGKLLVNEFCEPGPSHVTVRAAGGSGPAAEKAIEAAATACRFYTDAGTVVELVTPSERVGPARGLRHLDRMLEALARLGEGAEPRPAPPPAEGVDEADDPAWRALTYAGLPLAFAAMFLIDEISPRVLWALSPALALGFFVQRRARSPLPEPLWHALSIGTLLWAVGIDWRASGVTVANSHLLLYLLVNRALHPLSRKDLPQAFLIQFLAFFLASGLTISLWYFAFFLAYLGYCAAWLLRAAGVGLRGARERAGAVAALTLSGALVASASFVVTPRVEGLRKYNPFLAAGIDKLAAAPQSVTGFTENVTLGYYGLLKRSSARVMQVRPLATVGSKPAALYVRGAAYDSFDGRRWRKASGDFRFKLRGRRHASFKGSAKADRVDKELFFPGPSGGPEALFDFTIYPMPLSAVFTVGTPRALESSVEVSFDRNSSLSFADPYDRGTRYRLRAGLPARGLSLDDPDKASSLQALSDDARVSQLARLAAGSAATPEAKVAAVEAFLRRNFRYSLFGEGAGHTLEDFLFKSRRGNCEYFATAGAALLRELGVPARLATGFLASDWNEYGRFYDVRQSEAHAWVEAYVAGRGWITTDPTPSQGALSAAVDDLGHKLSRWFDAVEIEWYRRVIGYDQYVQGNTFRRLSLAFSPESLLSAARGAARALGWLALAFAAAALWAARGRLRARRAPTLWERAEALLAAAGLARERGLTPREAAAAWALARPAFRGLPALAELHYAREYERRALSDDEERLAARALRELKESL